MICPGNNFTLPQYCFTLTVCLLSFLAGIETGEDNIKEELNSKADYIVSTDKRDVYVIER